MPWSHVRLSIDDLALGKHIRLQNMFETLFLSRGEPAEAVMLVNSNAKDDYTYYFSPPCAVFFAGVLSQFGASAGYPLKAGHSIASSTYRQSLVALTGWWHVIDF